MKNQMKWLKGAILGITSLCGLAMIAFLSMKVAAEEEKLFEYSLNDKNEAIITQYKGREAVLDIPETIDGYTIVGIGDGAFQWNSYLRKVSMPNTIKTIGENAFRLCSSMETVTLSKGLEDLGGGAFEKCTSLTSIEIPKNLKKISMVKGYYVFAGCDSLKSATFEQGTAIVVERLFRECSGLEEVILPDSITTIEADAFHDCKSLKRITIGNSVTTVGKWAFMGDTGLTEIEIPDSVTEICDFAFSGCENLQKVTLSKKLETVEYYAFADCVSLTRIEIPKSLIKADRPFVGCNSLKDITFEQGTTTVAGGLFWAFDELEEIVIPDTVTKIGDRAFLHCENLKKVVLSKNLTELGDAAFNCCYSLSSIEIPKSLVTAGSSVFTASGLKNVTFEQGITAIVPELFVGCADLEEVVIPDTVTIISKGAFAACKNLKKVVLSKNLEELGERAFSGCNSLSCIEIPKSIVSVGNLAFEECDSLKTVTFEQGITTVVARLFYGCKGLEEIVIPDTVTSIQDYAFAACDNLKKVTMGSSVTSIEFWAFSYPDRMTVYGVPKSYAQEWASVNGATFVSLSGEENPEEEKLFMYSLNDKNEAIITGYHGSEVELSIPETIDGYTVAGIGNYAFARKDGLKKVIMPDSIKTIEFNAFLECKSLETVQLSKKLEEIQGGAFDGCVSLAGIEIPKSLVRTPMTSKGVFEGSGLKEITFEQGVTTIPMYLGACCNQLEEIIIPDTVTKIDHLAFQNCVNLKTVVLSKNLETLGGGVFYNCSALTNIEIPKSLVNITGSGKVFEGCDNLTNVIFEQGITTVTEGLFENCSGLEEIVIPDTVSLIQKYAFANCQNLKKVVLSKNLEELEYCAFSNCSSLTSIEIPGSLRRASTKILGENKYCGAFSDCVGLKKVILAEGARSVVSGLFTNCSGLEEIVLPDSIEIIGSFAFANCENLKKITMGRTLYAILTEAFTYPERMTVYGYSGTYAEEWANTAGAKFVDLSTYGPADILEERLDEAVTSALEAAMELPVDLDTATAEEKKQAVDSVLEQMQTACQKQNLAELGALSADTAISYVEQLGAVENRIEELLGTTVSVVHKDSVQTFALPTVTNALLNVPAGENAVIKVAEVKSPVFDEVEDQTVTALTFELFNSAGQKLSLFVPVLVVMPIPSTVDVQKEIVIYHFREDGTSYTEKIPVVLDEKAGTISFVVGSFSTFVIANAPDGVAVSGTVTSFGDETAQTTVRILDGNESEVARTTVVGKSATYTLEGILPGTYTLEVSKANHVTRQYSIIVESEAVVQDAGIWLIGDVNGDGNINSKDKKVLFNHIAGNSVLTDYAFLVGDITSDGNINSKDKKAMFNHIANISKLW